MLSVVATKREGITNKIIMALVRSIRRVRNSGMESTLKSMEQGYKAVTEWEPTLGDMDYN